MRDASWAAARDAARPLQAADDALDEASGGALQEASGGAMEGALDGAIRIATRVVLAGLCGLALVWAGSGIRQVPPDARAAVLRFGEVARVAGPGLLLAWPRPVERVVLVPAAGRQIELDVTEGSAHDVDSEVRANAGFLLTGDLGIVWLKAALFYEVTDPRAYLLGASRIPTALRRLFDAAALQACAGRSTDDVLAIRPQSAPPERETPAPSGAASLPRPLPPGGDEEGDADSDPGEDATAPTPDAVLAEIGSPARLRTDILTDVNARLQALASAGTGLGIALDRVDLTVALPVSAKATFDAVLSATQTADRDLAQARTGAAQAMQSAAQSAAGILSDAQARAGEQVSEAAVATVPLKALAAGAAEPRPQLMQRLFQDRIGRVLGAAAQIQVVDPAGSARLLLPGTAGGEP